MWAASVIANDMGTGARLFGSPHHRHQLMMRIAIVLGAPRPCFWPGLEQLPGYQLLFGPLSQDVDMVELAAEADEWSMQIDYQSIILLEHESPVAPWTKSSVVTNLRPDMVAVAFAVQNTLIVEPALRLSAAAVSRTLSAAALTCQHAAAIGISAAHSDSNPMMSSSLAPAPPGSILPEDTAELFSSATRFASSGKATAAPHAAAQAKPGPAPVAPVSNKHRLSQGPFLSTGSRPRIVAAAAPATARAKRRRRNAAAGGGNSDSDEEFGWKITLAALSRPDTDTEQTQAGAGPSGKRPRKQHGAKMLPAIPATWEPSQNNQAEPASTPKRTTEEGINMEGINMEGIKVGGIKVEGIKVEGIKGKGIKVEGIKVDGIKVGGIKLEGIKVERSLSIAVSSPRLSQADASSQNSVATNPLPRGSRCISDKLWPAAPADSENLVWVWCSELRGPCLAKLVSAAERRGLCETMARSQAVLKTRPVVPEGESDNNQVFELASAALTSLPGSSQQTCAAAGESLQSLRSRAAATGNRCKCKGQNCSRRHSTQCFEKCESDANFCTQCKCANCHKAQYRCHWCYRCAQDHLTPTLCRVQSLAPVLRHIMPADIEQFLVLWPSIKSNLFAQVVIAWVSEPFAMSYLAARIKPKATPAAIYEVLLDTCESMAALTPPALAAVAQDISGRASLKAAGLLAAMVGLGVALSPLSPQLSADASLFVPASPLATGLVLQPLSQAAQIPGLLQRAQAQILHPASLCKQSRQQSQIPISQHHA